MLKPRVIVQLNFCEGVLFRTKRFAPDYRYTRSFLGSEAVDEVVMVDVTPPSRYDRDIFTAVVERFASECFVPIAVGGHVSSVEDVIYWLRHGADKIIGGWRCQAKGVIEEITQRIGSQVLACSIDHRGDTVWFGSGCAEAGRRIAEQAVWLRGRGAGELLLNSIDRDGSLLGYDLATLKTVSEAVPDCPIIVAGGCGTWRHMSEAFLNGASGAVTSVIHHLTDSSMKACKAWLRENCPIPMRPAA